MDTLELVKELEVQRAETQTLRNDLAKALGSLEQANAHIKQLEGQVAETQTLRSDLAKALGSLEQANARIKQLEGQAAEAQTLHNTLAKALEGLEQANARIKQLEGQVAKDSRNSSKPPSSNGFKEPKRKTKSLREKSGKKSGGQPGHAGKTLMMVEHPDHTVLLTPERCEYCQQDLATASLARRERVQQFDLPSVHLQVTEYQVEVKVCPCCRTETRADLPDGLTPASVQYGPNVKTLAVYLACVHLLPLARVCQILSDLFGTTFSEASVLAACQQSARALVLVLEMIKTALLKSKVLHNDETGFRVNKKRWWLHVAATVWFTLYLAHPKRGKEAIDAMGILPHFRGTSLHDSFASYLHYLCIHALCLAHYLRELTFIFEHYGQLWAKEMKALLLEIKADVEFARQEGKTSLPEATTQDFERRYKEIVQTGLAANPPPPKPVGKKGPSKKSDALNLLIRLHQYQDMILRFMHDFTVPFDNNLAESDLRMMKLRQKISGCFRTEAGVALFCDLRSYLSTMQKQGVHLLTALRSAIVGSPLLPPRLAAE
jgi:transposase